MGASLYEVDEATIIACGHKFFQFLLHCMPKNIASHHRWSG
jgi:hypothetical protein